MRLLLSRIAVPSTILHSGPRYQIHTQSDHTTLPTAWHGFPAPVATTVAGRCPACPRLARYAAPRGGGSGGSAPLIFGAGAPPGRGKWATLKATIYPPLRDRVAPSTVAPGGKAIEPARRLAPGAAAPKQRTSRPQLAHWLAKAGTRKTMDSTPDVRRVEPHGCQLADGFVPSRSVAILLWTHPFTARKVHRNPIQNGGCNGGNGSAMECVNYLYQ